LLPISPKMLHEILNVGRYDRERMQQEAGEVFPALEISDPASGLEESRLARLRNLIKSLRPARALVHDWESR
jgi:hypothetical protein